MTRNLQYFTSKETLFKIRGKHPLTEKWAYFENVSISKAKQLNPILVEWEYVE